MNYLCMLLVFLLSGSLTAEAQVAPSEGITPCLLDNSSLPMNYNAIILEGQEQICPFQEQLDTAKEKIDLDIRDIIRNISISKEQAECIMYVDCRDAYERGQTQSGVYIIKPDGGDSFAVYCDMEIDGAGWVVFQRRQDGSQDFFLYWNDYERGFGNLNGNFWLGLSKIHRLTASAELTDLRVDLEDFSNNTGYAKYANFGVGNSSSNYTLTLSDYSGTAGDSLTLSSYSLSGTQFSTRDRDNDALTTGSCANINHGAWWFRSCASAHLNGVYMTSGSTPSLQAIAWGQFTVGGFYPLKYADMKLRRIYS